nr:MAG TPA: hypothetical protein [Caudoviricetes sp.]
MHAAGYHKESESGIDEGGSRCRDGAYGQRRACHPYLGREHSETIEGRTQ